MNQFEQIIENKKAGIALLVIGVISGTLLSETLAIATLVAAAGSRLHGSDAKYNTALGILFYSAAFFLVFQPNAIVVFLAALLYWAGESMGVGSIFRAWLMREPLSDKDNEGWQVGFLKHNLHSATIARGLMFGVGLSLVMGYLAGPLVFAAALLGYATCYYTIPFARWVFKDEVTSNADPAWWFSEIIRGWWVMFVPALTYYLSS